MSDDFNVVQHALQEYRDKLSAMNESNDRAGLFGVMDQLRLQQIETLDDAIADLASVERAARAAEREACIAAVLAEALDDPPDNDQDRAYMVAIEHCVAALRARAEGGA